MNLQGDTVLITGAARRLGRAMALALAAKGADVVVHYHRSSTEALALVEELKGLGRQAWAVQGDLSAETACRGVLESMSEAVGRPLQHLVNNASIFPQDTLATISKDSLASNMALHALAPQILGQGLYDAGSLKTVTNLLDTRVVDYDREHVSYHLSKRMLMSLNAMMALEWAPSVRVNAVAPGLVLPPEGEGAEYLAARAHTNPLERVGAESDIAEAVLFLMTSAFITGQIIYVDGGRHLKGRVYE